MYEFFFHNKIQIIKLGLMENINKRPLVGDAAGRPGYKGGTLNAMRQSGGGGMWGDRWTGSGRGQPHPLARGVTERELHVAEARPEELHNAAVAGLQGLHRERLALLLVPVGEAVERRER